MAADQGEIRNLSSYRVLLRVSAISIDVKDYDRWYTR